MRNFIKQSKAITLIALVITIIVLLILAGVIIATLTGDNGLLTKAEEGVFIAEIEQYNEELKISISEDQLENLGFRTQKFNVRRNIYSDDDKFLEAMKEIIPSFDKKYANRFEIIDDELIYIGENAKEREWLDQIIKVGGMLTINYLYEDGSKAATSYQKVITDGAYEVESPNIDGYIPSQYLVSGVITGNTDITVTYYGESQGLEYQLLDDGTYTISGAGTFNGQNLIIPRKYNNSLVTKIKGNAFNSKSNIKKVIISKEIREIGQDAFKACTGITQIIMGENVEKIDRAAFCYCYGLKEIALNDKISKIDELTFYSCYGIEKITIGKNVNTIRKTAFDGCTKWTQTILSAENNNYKLIDNVLYSNDNKSILIVPTGISGKFTVSDNITSIGSTAFAYCSKITEIDFGINTLRLGNKSFASCTGLTSINIGNSIEYIDVDCFHSCTNITNITVGNSVNTIKQAAFCYCQKLTSMQMSKNVSSIGNQLFYGDSKLNNINYGGTKEEWNSINKTNSWRQGANITQIICTDGTINI